MVWLQSLWLRRVVWLAGFGLAGIALAQWLSPAPLLLATTADASVNEPTPLARAFGATATVSSAPLRPADVRIIGVLAGSELGGVLVSVKNGPSKLLSQGQTTDDGWTLLSIDPAMVRLGHHGAVIEVALPKARGGGALQ